MGLLLVCWLVMAGLMGMPPGWSETPTPLPGLDIADSVLLHGTVTFEEDTLPEGTLVLETELASLRFTDLKQSLSERQPPEAMGKALSIVPPLDPRRERLEKAAALLMLFGTGVYHNIESRETAKENLMANLKNPMGRVAYGWSYDNDSFRTNFIEHPVLWFGYATYLKSKGASDKETLLVTQAANLVWEGVMEGAYVPPSGKDLLTDLISSVAGIYLYNKGPGKSMGEKLLAIERWGAKRNMRLKPVFSYNPYSRGGRAATHLEFFVR